jgi:DNA-binding NarL/FixJ family response regulator
MATTKIRLLLTDDHTLFRQGVRTLLQSESDIEVVAEAANAADAVSLAAETRPDVVLLDIGMPGLSSFEAARLIRRDRPETRLVFLTMYDDEDYLAECMDVGAAGYVLKDSPAEHLVTAIREIARGGSYLSPRMLSRLVNDFRMQARGEGSRLSRFGTLTKREREILKLLAEGNSVKEIASSLDLSVKTVEAHKFNLMRKLDLHNKAQLVQYAIQKKIIRLPEM